MLTSRLLCAALASFCITIGALTTSAQAAVSEIAVVNVQSIIKSAAASQTIQKQLEAKRAQYQSEIDKQEESLRKQDAELSKQRNILSKEAYEQKVAEFKKHVAEVQKGVQTKRTKLDNAYAAALLEVQKVTVTIISEMASKEGFKVAIPTSQILYAQNGLDISDAVLAELNKRLTKVDVKVEN
ncbi:MAG: outer membrane protein [Rickettsiales bacterium]|jgi:Skp family chaperone for outer membrane proteins|nr:outer membrane protein [Rickettsiales bacterium]